MNIWPPQICTCQTVYSQNTDKVKRNVRLDARAENSFVFPGMKEDAGQPQDTKCINNTMKRARLTKTRPVQKHVWTQYPVLKMPNGCSDHCLTVWEKHTSLCLHNSEPKKAEASLQADMMPAGFPLLCFLLGDAPRPCKCSVCYIFTDWL